MKNFAILSVLLVCFLVVSVTARYALVDLDRVSAAMKAQAPYPNVADYASGKLVT